MNEDILEFEKKKRRKFIIDFLSKIQNNYRNHVELIFSDWDESQLSKKSDWYINERKKYVQNLENIKQYLMPPEDTDRLIEFLLKYENFHLEEINRVKEEGLKFVTDKNETNQKIEEYSNIYEEEFKRDMKIFESNLFISRDKVDNSALEEYDGIPVAVFTKDGKKLLYFAALIVVFLLLRYFIIDGQKVLSYFF